jgi:hypothetical protein
MVEGVEAVEHPQVQRDGQGHRRRRPQRHRRAAEDQDQQRGDEAELQPLGVAPFGVDLRPGWVGIAEAPDGRAPVGQVGRREGGRVDDLEDPIEAVVAGERAGPHMARKRQTEEDRQRRGHLAGGHRSRVAEAGHAAPGEAGQHPGDLGRASTVTAAIGVAVVGGQHHQILAEVDAVEKRHDLAVQPRHPRPVLRRRAALVMPGVVDVVRVHQRDPGAGRRLEEVSRRRQDSRIRRSRRGTARATRGARCAPPPSVPGAARPARSTPPAPGAPRRCCAGRGGPARRRSTAPCTRVGETLGMPTSVARHCPAVAMRATERIPSAASSLRPSATMTTDRAGRVAGMPTRSATATSRAPRTSDMRPT